jgi:energy-converting hydrogenase Eha subunit F
MNCRRVEKLIPLYVGGDLASEKADRITSHLEWCGRCNSLVDEYNESQGWLHSYEPPVFDELTGLKVGVLRRIEETSSAPSLLASLVQQWSRRQVFALSTAALIILGMVMLYVYQMRETVSPPTPELVELKLDSEPSPPYGPTPVGGPDQSPGTGLTKRHHQSRRRSTVRASYATPTIAERVPAPVDSQDDSVTDPGGVRANETTLRTVDSPAPLRIEIQTSDPNIRIIWFAPKETDSHQTKAATD